MPADRCTTRPGRLRRIGLLALLAASACSSETGILVAVAGSSVEELEFQVGIERAGVFVLDREASGQRRNVKGRDLRARPYELLLFEEDPSGTPLRVRVLVLGLSKGEVRSFDVTDPPQAFIREEVVRRSLSLVRVGESASTSTYGKGCFRAWRQVGEKRLSWVLVADDDRDCDGYHPSGQPPDCDDQDDDVHPGAKEICDGKDNNCDGKYAPTSQICYALKETVCRQGTRACADAKGGGLAESCVVSASSPKVAAVFCDAYSACKKAPDPLSCTEGKMKDPYKLTCTGEQVDGEGVCKGSVYWLEPLEGSAASCRWDVVDTGGFEVGLSDGKSAPASSLALCKVQLVLAAGSAPGKGPVVLELKDGDKSLGVLHVTIKLDAAAACSGEALKCTP